MNEVRPMITIPSNRIYLDSLEPERVAVLLQTRRCYAAAKEKLYNLKYDSRILGHKQEATQTSVIKSWIREHTGLSPQEYYITSLEGHAGGILFSQLELQKLRKTEYLSRCENRRRKLKTLRRRMTLLIRSKEALIRFSRDGGKGKLYVPQDFAKHMPAEKAGDGAARYAYELWVDLQLRRTRSRIALIEEKGRNDAAGQQRLISRVTFGGGKKFYRLKDTTDISPKLWHEERTFAREKDILFSGRYNSKYKNWLVRYTPQTGRMEITLMDCSVLVLENVCFPYRGDELAEVLSHKKEPGWSVGYWMEFRKDHTGREFLLMKASFHTGEYRVNLCTDTGVIGADLNEDNISWSETDREGHLLHTGMIRFKLEGKTSSQATDILGRACTQLVSLCRDKHKPLVLEDLDLRRKKASLAYGSRNANRKISAFAFRKMDALITGKAARFGVGVINVNPAYTSFFGKIRYMRAMKAPVHQAASYCIARRGMGYRERIPAYLCSALAQGKRRTHSWSQAASLMALIKGLPSERFLSRLPVFENKQHLQTYILRLV